MIHRGRWAQTDGWDQCSQKGLVALEILGLRIPARQLRSFSFFLMITRKDTCPSWGGERRRGADGGDFTNFPVLQA